MLAKDTHSSLLVPLVSCEEHGFVNMTSVRKKTLAAEKVFFYFLFL
jgi:hypothetical protein